MNKKNYTLIENYMLSCMKDSAHGEDHIYRVLYHALKIAETEKDVDYDVLITACLLHDIGRKEQFENPKVCHAQVGAEKAYKFLLENEFDVQYAEQVRYCIEAHRYRENNLPETIEAKILFDADKLDVTGAIGIARTLLYKGKVAEPLYSLLQDGMVSDGTNDSEPSFSKEYKYKLEGLYSKFFTKKAEELAQERQAAAVTFYIELYQEVQVSYENGIEELEKMQAKKVNIKN